MRAENVIARWGGDEFLLMVKDVKEEGLLQCGNRLVKLVNNSAVVEGHHRISVTASIGATMLRTRETHQAAVQRADALMYRSKELGGATAILG